MSANAGPVPLAHLDMSVADGLSAAQVRAVWRAVAEARAAVALWGEHVRALAVGEVREKVVPLRRPA
jgi:hypothetical protein